MRNCNDTCRPGFVPGPPAPNYVSGCALEQAPLLKTYVLPASLGTDAPDQPYAPTIGAFRNAIVVYEANGHVYIYDSLGTPTLINDAANSGGGEDMPINVVQTTGNSTSAVMSQNAVTNELDKTNTSVTSLSNRVTVIEQNGGGSSVSVVQNTGSSTTAVMSQNAVTKTVNDAISMLEDKIAESESGSNFQEKLVSGQNIQTIGGNNILKSGNLSFKTVGGQSIFGSGDIPLESENNSSASIVANQDFSGGINSSNSTITKTWDNFTVTSAGLYMIVSNVSADTDNTTTPKHSITTYVTHTSGSTTNTIINDGDTASDLGDVHTSSTAIVQCKTGDVISGKYTYNNIFSSTLSSYTITKL